MSPPKKIKLWSSDGDMFEVEEAVAMQSQTINFAMEGCTNGVIPLYKVPGKILAKVIEYCKKHADANATIDNSESAEAELKKWDANFVNVDQAILFHLMLAANYMAVNNLLDLTVQRVADMVKGHTPAEIRKIFNIKNDFTPEEEEEVRRHNQWSFD